MIRETFSTHGKIDYFKIIMFGVAVIVITGCFLILWLIYLDDNPPLVINETHIINPTVNAGEFMVISADLCKNTNHSGEIRVNWENDTITPQSPVYSNFEKGCREFVYRWKVPGNLPDDVYTAKFSILYNTSPLVERIVRYDLGPVTVRTSDRPDIQQ